MKPVPGILNIAPYVAGRSEAPVRGPVYKLSSNETPLGAGRNAIEAFTAASVGLNLYPDGSARALRQAIAETHGLEAGRIICGNGSDEILHLLPQIYAGPGDEILFSAHGFLVYPIATLAAGATPVVVPEPDLRTDVDGFLRHATDRTRIAFLANPNNPTGSFNTSAELRRLRAGLPEECLLVVDAAYAEYVDAEGYETGAALVASTPNTVMTRTFSKVYGLAALRVGWAYAPAGVVDAYERVRGPFNVSAPAQAAAVAAVRDQAHVAAGRAHNSRWRNWLAAEIAALGLKVHPSVANFILVDFDRTGPRTAAAADEFLASRGVIVRAVSSYGLPHCLRISVGSEEGNRAAVAALAEFMA
ncbi:MAG: histidinol-phosphate transaminase [Alphaproteobacteria bacterium]|nr:histidinol-phosphate transaminase [Alphaproteobacteria bacterium]